MQFIAKDIIESGQRRGGSTSYRSFEANHFDLAPGKTMKLVWSVCVVPKLLFPSTLFQANNTLRFSPLSH